MVEIVKESYVDHTQFDKKDPHYDPKSKKEKPKWFMVDVKVCLLISINLFLGVLNRLPFTDF